MASYLITGSARGIGLELATQLASSSEASIVFATSRKESPGLKELIQKSNGRVVFIELDTTSADSIKKAVLAVEKTLGDGKGLDVLINNAGIMDYTPDGPLSLAGDELTNCLTTNVIGVHLVTQAFFPLLEKGNLKKVANISSTVGSFALVENYRPAPSPAYKVSKAALNMLTVQWSMTYGEKGFTIFSVSPGWLKTELAGGIGDLEVDVGVKATLDKILGAGKEDNGAFKNIYIEGWHDPSGRNVYDGKDPGW